MNKNNYSTLGNYNSNKSRENWYIRPETPGMEEYGVYGGHTAGDIHRNSGGGGFIIHNGGESSHDYHRDSEEEFGVYGGHHKYKDHTSHEEEFGVYGGKTSYDDHPSHEEEFSLSGAVRRPYSPGYYNPYYKQPNIPGVN